MFLKININVLGVLASSVSKKIRLADRTCWVSNWVRIFRLKPNLKEFLYSMKVFDKNIFLAAAAAADVFLGLWK